MSAPGPVTFEELKQARRTVHLLSREEYEESGPASPLFAGLVEAKRMLGIASNMRWPERWEELDGDTWG